MRLFRIVFTAVPLIAATLASAQPANDDCANATVVTALPFTEVVDTTSATHDASDPASPCHSPSGKTIWYKYTAPSALVLTVDVFEPGTNQHLGDLRVVSSSVRTGSCGTFGAELPECGAGEERAAVNVAAGQTVLIQVDSGDIGGNLRVTIDRATEFAVSLDKFDSEFDPASVAMNAAGRFMVVWEAQTDFAVRGRVFSSTGAPLAGELGFELNGQQPDVAAGTTGDFLVVWSKGDIRAQRVAAGGTPLGVPFTVNAYTTGGQGSPAVTADVNGGFVVVWDGQGASDPDGIFGRLVDSAGSPVGGDFQVNSSTTGSQYDPDVAADAAGNFVVVWNPGRGRLFSAGGAPSGGDFALADPLQQFNRAPTVARAPGGNFTVTWSGYRDDDPDPELDIWARVFDPSGVPLAAPFVVDTIPDYPQIRPTIAADAAGSFVVAWENDGGRDGYVGLFDIAARRLGPTGTPLAPQFEVAAVNQGRQYAPDVAAGSDGNFVVVWNDGGGDVPWGSSFALVARPFVTPGTSCRPAPLAGCRTPTVPSASRLLLLDDADDVRDRMQWTWAKGAATTPADFGDPTADEDYFLCLYGPSTALLFQADIPAGGLCGTRNCWRPVGNPPAAKGFRYKDGQRTPNGIDQLVLKPGLAGKAKIIAKGGNVNLYTGLVGAPPLPLPLPARLQLQTTSGACWETTYTTAGATRNESGFFLGAGS